MTFPNVTRLQPRPNRIFTYALLYAPTERDDSAVAVGTPIILHELEQEGSNIAVSPSVLHNTLTLKPGFTYELSANINDFHTSGQPGQLATVLREYRFYNVTDSEYFGFEGLAYQDNSVVSSPQHFGTTTAHGVIAPEKETVVQLRYTRVEPQVRPSTRGIGSYILVKSYSNTTTPKVVFPVGDPQEEPPVA